MRYKSIADNLTKTINIYRFNLPNSCVSSDIHFANFAFYFQIDIRIIVPQLFSCMDLCNRVKGFAVVISALKKSTLRQRNFVFIIAIILV